MLAQTPHRRLSDIASEVLETWRHNHVDHPRARPHVEAMLSLNRVTENYGPDTGRSVVLYFLTNAQAWRGPTARRIKSELRQILGK